MIDEKFVATPYEDYVQSANSLFHFVDKIDYLESIIISRALIPRFCIEDIGYLNLQVDGIRFEKVAILQKCFCDIPLHKIMEPFEVGIIENSDDSLNENEKARLKSKNTHPDFYGKYAIALPKTWGEQNRLLPVHYINENSAYPYTFSCSFSKIHCSDDPPEEYVEDILSRLSYIKPLRGIISRRFEKDNHSTTAVRLIKNFHDECEWRYVPEAGQLADAELERIIANSNILALKDSTTRFNDNLGNEKYQGLWLRFTYDEIRYIIVPDSQARIDIIDTIEKIPNERFDNPTRISLEKNILISKIIVLDEIRKDM